MRESVQLTKEVTSATIGGNYETHEYDSIGNSIIASFNGTTNAYSANNLNQYTMVGRVVPNAPPCSVVPTYDLDGNLLSDGVLSFTYDAVNRLKTVSTNGVQILVNFYDAKSRRVKKVTSEATTTFFYDDWNLIEERVAYTNGTTSTIRYYWGKDLSGDLQGAGGVGGLLYLSVNGTIYIPCYDNNGNITRYLDTNGNTVAQYTYDAFGKIISKSGPLADFFRHRFSTKYYDLETVLYYYGYRFYHPIIMRWLNRDPLEEDEGENLYAMCENSLVDSFDELGLLVVTRESAGKSRRVYQVERGDTIESLAKEVGLDKSEFSKWAKKEKGKIADKKTAMSISSLPNPGCYVSVPNIWISADLLRGGNWYYDSIVNFGGTIGRTVGTDVFTSSDHKIVKADDIKQLNAAFRASKGDIWGIVVFGHGNKNGVLSMKRDYGIYETDWTYQSELIAGIQAGGYKIASAYMMQCYSAYKGLDRYGKNVDYDAAWRKVAVKFYGYKGMNAFMIDFGSSGKKKRKLRHGRRR